MLRIFAEMYFGLASNTSHSSSYYLHTYVTAGKFMADTKPSTLEPIPWSLREVVVGTIIVALFTVAFLLISRPLLNQPSGRFFTVLPIIAGLSETVLIAIIWFLAVRPPRGSWRNIGFRSPKTDKIYIFGLGVLLGSFGFTAIYAFCALALDIEALLPPPIPKELLGTGFLIPFNLISIVVWVPIIEEAFFRGFILTGLHHKMGIPKALIISSAIFAAVHISPGVLIPIFVTGLLLGALYLRTKSLWPSIVIHSIQNLLVSVVAASM